jgi:hypothetical protein
MPRNWQHVQQPIRPNALDAQCFSETNFDKEEDRRVAPAHAYPYPLAYTQ